MTTRRFPALLTAIAVLIAPTSLLASRATGSPPRPAAVASSTPELSETTRLPERRSLVVGDRWYEMGTEDGKYPATGFHTRGEMGGFWSQPIKLLDGVWFRAGDTWLTASKYTSGWGYQRMDLGTHDGVTITRTDVAPSGVRAGLIGLKLDSPTATTLDLTMDAHSELMKVYPWGETNPSQTTYNLQDDGARDGNSALFTETGTPNTPNAEAHDYAALVGSNETPTSVQLGPDYRGPQDPAVICPASGPNAPAQPDYCDDTAYGKGTGAQLTYHLSVPAGGRTVWFSVAGSDKGVSDARQAQSTALANPDALVQQTLDARAAADDNTKVSLPGDQLLEQSVAWSKQNLVESVQEARDLKIRVSNAGTTYPAPSGTVAKIRWIGAGWPDYPWLFATDGEYSAFAAVASGQFTAIENHLRALRDVSAVANGNSGKIVHEVTPDGQVYFGANNDPGNTDETAKFPSVVALVYRWTGDKGFLDEMYPASVRAMKYIYRELDQDGDGWPEGLGNVERTGMGEEKLDNTVYTIRGLLDLAQLAAAKGDSTTRQWAADKAADLRKRFESTWWYGPSAQQYADSLDDPGNVKVFQRHWIGVTPVEAELTLPGFRYQPLASKAHADALVAKREESCYSGEFGLFHTGTTGCDTAPAYQGERTVFTLNTSIMAAAEGALGRMKPGQLPRYTTANARVQLDPSVWELPGAMPEISPSPDFGANIDRKFTERSMALQAWGTYGILWPVVHFELGVFPDVGRGKLRVVPQVPDGQTTVSGDHSRLGSGAADVTGRRTATQLTTDVTGNPGLALTVGALLPPGTSPTAVTLNGAPASYTVVTTYRGQEVRVDAGRASAAHLVVTYH